MVKSASHVELLVNDPLYDIREDGSVWSKTYSGRETKEWRKLKISPSSDGYYRFSYNHQRLLLHRVIYRKFAGRLDPTTVDHIDDDKSNNRFDNLQQLTIADNVRKGQSKLTWEIVKEIREKYADLEKPYTRLDLKAAEYGISEQSLRHILDGTRW